MKNIIKAIVIISMISGSVHGQISSGDIPPRPVNNCGTNDGPEDYEYSSCKSQYDSALSNWTRLYGTAANNTTQAATSTGISYPTKNYGPCNRYDSSGISTIDEACRQRVDADYETAVKNYEAIKEAERIAQAQRNAAQSQYDSAKQAAIDAQNRNEAAKGKYNLAGMLSGIASGVGFAMFAASCGPAGCTNFPALAVGIAMAIYSMKSSQQANSHAGGASSACQLANTISTNQATCAPSPGPFVPGDFPRLTNPPLTEIVDNNGTCIASADLCRTIKENLPPGTDLKDFKKGLDAFAAGKIPVKINPDGSITSRGKKYSISDLDSYDKLRAAGFTPEQAKAMMADLARSKSIGDEYAKGGAGGAGGTAGGTGDDALGDGTGTTTAGTGLTGTGNGTADGSLDANGKRAIASAEGLAVDFNGELVGAAGDDIWKMMNRRYRLKDTQDAFMSPKQ